MIKKDQNSSEKNLHLIHIMSREYLNFTVAAKIIERSMKIELEGVINDKENK